MSEIPDFEWSFPNDTEREGERIVKPPPNRGEIAYVIGLHLIGLAFVGLMVIGGALICFLGGGQ